MAYTTLPDFTSSRLDASKNGQQLCDELKRLYDYLFTAVASGRFKWDKVAYSYDSSSRVTRVEFKKGSITIRKNYEYSSGKVSVVKCYIHNVPPKLNNWQFVHGQQFNYDSAGRVTSITNRGQ